MTTITDYLIIIIVLILALNCDTYPIQIEQPDYNKYCSQLPSIILTEILGAAFNSRYMSINEPLSLSTNDMSTLNGKRDSIDLPSFYVDDNYSSELSNQPAWEVVEHASVKMNSHNDAADAVVQLKDKDKFPVRDKRSSQYQSSKSSVSLRPWECEAKIRWIDLGPNYFPRFLRTIECTKHLCWYGHYTCQPRSFTVKLLRRRNGECVTALTSSESFARVKKQYPQNGRAHKNTRIGVDGLPGDLRELWIWEERAVNFCCDCAAPQ